MLDLQAIRESEFPFTGEAIYLNAAAVAPIPERARLATEAYNRKRSRVHEMEDADFVAPLRRTREAAARLIGADAAEIALGQNTSFGINLAAQSLPIEAGTTVLVSDREFPANVYPWVAMRDARLELVAVDALGRPDADRIADRLERGDVSIFALSSVQFSTGYRAELSRFGEICRRRGIFFVVDAIQSLGQLPLDVRESRIDVLATGGHKWLLSPFGSGFVYVRRDLIERMEPRMVGWTALKASADLASVTEYRWEFRDDARRFEMATLPLQDFVGMAESLELLLEVGVARIQAHLEAALEPLRTWLSGRAGVEVLGDRNPDRRSAILAFRTSEPERCFAALQAAGVTAALREGAIRIAPHLYNTREEIERVVEILDSSATVGWR